ncbi:uncharacterized protein K452DRAFT_299779 [Aplosporella prunicola CBS 121167]|uniref:Uncharacterized protein n=1 Tax=Aplosporella prunicola CBS 121167 TaxID=1176127 RepID=A0A6A6B911_9PEZI|nr:uncharacterized protein K452DRAFT_299779 [Aplosporella prunicola CBS 121167]KAF2139785.1 hypothetical protein K452DRAFT_299779 [Aplosporella prunicola CBS 121167]
MAAREAACEVAREAAEDAARARGPGLTVVAAVRYTDGPGTLGERIGEALNAIREAGGHIVRLDFGSSTVQYYKVNTDSPVDITTGDWDDFKRIKPPASAAAADVSEDTE